MKIFFVTFGCRLNQAETEKLKAEAAHLGHQFSTSESEADMVIINSCSVTDKAQREADKYLQKFRAKYPDKHLIITGCGARDEHKKYAAVIKNDSKSDLFSIIAGASSCHSEYSEAEPRNPLKNYRTQDGERDFSARRSAKLVEMTGSGRTRLMYKVQDGCDNFCAYCIVPYLRGRERSFPADEIIRDIQKAEKAGYKEVVLCGVNVGKYSFPVNTTRFDLAQGRTLQNGNQDLAGLMGLILKETKIPRIRLSSINPDDFTNELIDLWAKNERLCPHFHISLQSGSDTILKRMGRKYTTQDYADLVKKLRSKIPDVQITTDVIVGFPGETEEEFAETVEFVREINFLKVHVFRYSPREGTRAAKMRDQISDKIKKERSVEMQGLESEIRQSILKQYIGKEVEVLFEQARPLPAPHFEIVRGSSSGLTRGSIYSGFTSNYIKVSKKSKKDLTNQLIRYKIEEIIKD